MRPDKSNALSRAHRAAWPSKDELERLLELHGTVSAVARVLGRGATNVRYIIEQLDISYVPQLQSGDSSNAVGWDGEKHAALVLGGRVVRVANPRAQPSFDVLVGDRRVEVKTARPSTASVKRDQWGWSFNVAHNHGGNDAYFLICCAPDGLPIAYLLVPSTPGLPKMIRFPVSQRGKWARYLWRPTTDPRAQWRFSRASG